MSHKFGSHYANLTKATDNSTYHGINSENAGNAGRVVGITGVAGDVSYISCNEVMGQKVDIGLFAQATKGQVKISFTLQNRKRACNEDPLVQKTIFWANEITVEPNTIIQLPVLFTACRVEFVEDSSFYMFAR